jgi:hypothetical protein
MRFITVMQGVGGYLAVLCDSDGPIMSGVGRYSTKEEAEQEAVEWQRSEGWK